MSDRRKFLQSILLVAPIAAAGEIPKLEKHTPRIIGTPMCVCGYHMQMTATEPWGAPVEAVCVNIRCEFFEKKFRMPTLPMEPV